jgi:glycolate oxidase
LGLTVVLDDGSIITPGRRTAKGVTGLDVTGLFVGSEGILGVITEATVRILPLPQGHTVTISAYFDDVHSAASCASDIARIGLNPLIMELMDSQCLGAVHAHLGLAAPPPKSAHLLVQFQEMDPSATVAEAQRLCTAHGAQSVTFADGEDAEQLLLIRRSVHPALAAKGTTLIEDVCVPRTQLAAMFAVIDEISRKYDLFIPTVSHAGDGNLHPNFVFDGPEVPDHVWQAANEIFLAALNLGGTLTGEHGVGVLKKRWLRDELGDREYELQRELKRVFDPKNILNPGKVF